MFTRLENTEGKHNKFYEVGLIPIKQEFDASLIYNVIARWGRIGTEAKTMIKHKALPEWHAAMKKQELINSKLKKGYEVIGTTKVTDDGLQTIGDILQHLGYHDLVNLTLHDYIAKNNLESKKLEEETKSAFASVLIIE